VVGGLAGAHPSGSRAADVVLSAVAAALVTGAAGFAKRWSWIVLATAATLAAHGVLGGFLGGTALVMTLVAVILDRRSQLLGEVVGALAVSALLLDGVPTPMRVSAAVGVCACALVVVSGYASAPRALRRRARRAVVGAGSAMGLLLALSAFTAVSARGSLEEGLRSVEEGIDAARVGDRQATIDTLHRAGDALRRAQADTDSALAIPTLALPGVGPNMSALRSAVDEGVKLTEAALTTALQVDPEALRPRGGRVDLAAVAATQMPLARVVTALERAQERLRSVHSPWLLAPVQHRLATVIDHIDRFLPGARIAEDAAEASPSLLGAGQPRRYLVLFVTPVEGRGSGFPGNFAELTVADGRMSLGRFGRSSELVAAPGSPRRTISGPADFLARYGRFDPAAGFIDVASSPDLPTVAEVYRELYPQAGGKPIDGVIRVDPVGLAALLRYTGPIEVASARKALTAENAADYLLREQYVTFTGAANAERIDVLDDLGHATFDRLTRVDLPGPQQLARDLGPMVQGQHLSMTTFDDTSRRLLDRTGLTGAVPPVNGDQIGVIINDIGGSKIDLFLERDIEYRASWDPDTGTIDATATVTLRNNAPAAGLPDYIIGNVVTANTPDHEVLPRGTNRAFVSIYSPWFPLSPKVDGVETPFQIEDELGRKVASLTIDIPAGGQRTLSVQVHGQLPIGQPYHLDIWRQSLALDGQATVHIKGPNGHNVDRQFSLGTNGTIWFRAG
jgi:hypothetical protein